MAFKIIPLAISLVLLGISPGTQAHKDGPGTHTAEKHDKMALVAYKYIEKHHCEENLYDLISRATKQAIEEDEEFWRGFVSPKQDNKQKIEEILIRKLEEHHVALIHAGKDEAEKRCRVFK